MLTFDVENGFIKFEFFCQKMMASLGVLLYRTYYLIIIFVTYIDIVHIIIIILFRSMVNYATVLLAICLPIKLFICVCWL